MQCGICFEPFNNEKNKPYAMVPCIHTLCYSCIQKLIKKVCPCCKKNFDSYSPNWILIDMIQESLKEKLKSEVLNYIESYNDLKILIDQNCEKRLKKIEIKYKTIENEITTHTRSIIRSIELIYSELLAKIDVLRLDEMNEIKKFSVRNSPKNNEIYAKNFFQLNLYDVQLNQLKSEYSKECVKLKTKLTELHNFREKNIEFVPNNQNVVIDIGSIRNNIQNVNT